MLDNVLIDDADRDRVATLTWRFNQQGYVYAYPMRNCVRRVVLLHRFIMGAQPGQIVDHINCNKLDNRRCNLRLCTNSQNNMNRPSPNGKPKGIRWIAGRQKWAAQVYLNGRQVWFRRFSDYDEAVKARHAAILHYHGEFARAV